MGPVTLPIEPISAIAPRPPRYFTGRKRQIANIVAEITGPNPTPVIAILGMGGIGKTALAKQIAENVKSNFPGGIFWGDELPSKDSNPSIILKQWGRLCGQNLEKESEENLPSVVFGLLKARQAHVGSMLAIVDDARLDWLGEGVKVIERALPHGIPLIITTRWAQVAQEVDAKIYNLNVLTRTESNQLLVSLSDEKITKSEARNIAELCGDMPLALELIAKLAKTRKSGWLLKRLQSQAERLDVLKLDEASKKEQSVKISLEISYQALVEQHPETAYIFRCLAAFARPTSIIFEHLVYSLVQSEFFKPPDQNSKKIFPRSGINKDSIQIQQKVMNNYENAVFVSYAWGGESEQMVDELEKAFTERGIPIIRDKKELGYRGSIKEFEERIGQGQCIVLVISDKYLRSEHCMYELVEVEKNRSLHERIFPIVLADARIYKALDRLTYIKHWDEQIEQLNQAIKQIDVITNLAGITADLDTYARIRANVDHLTDILSDMNVLTPDMHANSGFSSLISAVERVLPGRKIVPQPGNAVAQTQKTSYSRSESTPEQQIKFIEDNLLRLADWSLLLEDKDIKGSEMEYFTMHALLHEYAQSILVDTVEIEESVRNHILYCVAFAEANPQIDLQKQQRSTLEFEKSYGQLLQALAQIKNRYIVNGIEWKKESELAHQVILLVNTLDNHWQFHSQFAEQILWLQTAYLCAGALANRIKQADFARRVGRALTWQGQLDEALEWTNRSEEALGDDQSEEANAIRALMYIHRASVIYQKGDSDKAEIDCLHGIELVDVARQPRVYAEGYNLLGVIKMRIGKLTSALESLEKSLSTWEQVGDEYQTSRVNENVRNVLFYLGDIANLRKAEDASLKHWEQFPDRIELAVALTNRGLVHSIDGEYDAAIELHKRAMDISDELAVPRMQAMTRTNIAGPYISLEKYDEAEAYLNKSSEIQTEYDTKEYWVDAQRSLAEIALGRKLYEQAVELAENALDLAKEDEDPLEEGTALRVLGQALHMNGNLEQAREHLETSLSLLRDNEFKYESYLTLQALTKLYGTMGNTEKKQAMADEAQSLAKEMGINQPMVSSQ